MLSIGTVEWNENIDLVRGQEAYHNLPAHPSFAEVMKAFMPFVRAAFAATQDQACKERFEILRLVQAKLKEAGDAAAAAARS